MQELTKKEVPVELENKILKFAQEHAKFTTKEVFDKYPNNPEFMLRYAINNLRIDEKLFMHGNKRGAYYSLSKEEVEEATDDDNSNSSPLKELVLNAADKTKWFSRTDIKIDAPGHHILAALKELIAEGKVETRGSYKWTEYRIISEGDSTAFEESQVEADKTPYDLILEYVKTQKIVTIPMVVDELNLQRHIIVSVLERLCKEEIVWHEGIKKSSKYIYHTVSESEMQQILADLSSKKAIDDHIDDLSAFLLNGDDAKAISIGLNSDGEMQIKFMVNGTSSVKKFANINDGLALMNSMMDIKNA